MIRRILIIINPLTLFLLFNILSSNYVNTYEMINNIGSIAYVNIGSSHGRDGLNWENYSDSVNLGFGSQRMYYGLRLLESIEPHLDSSSTIIIPISVFSFCGRFEGPKQRYLGFISRNELNITLRDSILQTYFPYLGMNKNESLFMGLQSDNPFIENGVIEAMKHIEIAKSCNVIESEIVNLTESFIIKNNESRILFIVTPQYETYSSELLKYPEVSELVYSTVLQIVSEYGLEFYDYSNDLRFIQSTQLFRDSSHLNKEGSKKFTSILVDDLNNPERNKVRS